MARQGGKGGNRVPVDQLTPEQLKAFQARLGLQERAMEMAQAQADREYEAYLRRIQQQQDAAEMARQAEIEDATRAAQFAALQNVANIYGARQQDIQGQTANVVKQYEDQLAALRASFDTESAQVQKAYEDQLAGLKRRSGETASAFAARKQAVDSSFGNMISGLQNQFDAQAAQIEQQRAESLAQLEQGIARGQSTISESEAALLRDLVGSQAYSEAPLVELGQIQNPLAAGLAAEGASMAGVQGESEQARQAAAQLAALSRGAMRQLNVGEENYLRALQNAGRFAAAQSRQDLAVRGATIGQGIRSRFDELANQVAMSRLASIQQAEAQRQAELGALGEREFAAMGELDASTAATQLAALQAQQAAAREREDALRRAQEQALGVRLGLQEDAAAAAAKAAEARAQAASFEPIVRTTPMPVVPEPTFDYAKQLEDARLAALANLRSALPQAQTPPVVTTPSTVTKTGKKGTKRVSDPFAGTSYIPNEMY
jgi:hypothetical protein